LVIFIWTKTDIATNATQEIILLKKPTQKILWQRTLHTFACQATHKAKPNWQPKECNRLRFIHTFVKMNDRTT
jgi:hypothetical protein